jgi:hypothetical protein
VWGSAPVRGLRRCFKFVVIIFIEAHSGHHLLSLLRPGSARRAHRSCRAPSRAACFLQCLFQRFNVAHGLAGLCLVDESLREGYALMEGRSCEHSEGERCHAAISYGRVSRTNAGELIRGLGHFRNSSNAAPPAAAHFAQVGTVLRNEVTALGTTAEMPGAMLIGWPMTTFETGVGL